jgi:hypothetical protein
MKWRTAGAIGALVVATVCFGLSQTAAPSAFLNFAPAAALAVLNPNENYCQSLLRPSAQADALRSACMFSLSLTQNMPNFVCEMSVEKYEDITRTFRSTHYMQKVHAQARYVNGKDYYDDLRINGRLVEGTSQLVEGTWSFGEFGAKLLAAFNPKNRPKFSFSRDTKVNGVPAFEYAFRVEHGSNRFWRWLWGKRSTLPGYEGKVAVSTRDGRILRLELDSAQGVPDDFPIQSIESKTDYSYFDFKDRSGFVLPSKAHIVTRMLDHRVYRTNITFSHCKRFKVDSRIISEASQK